MYRAESGLFTQRGFDGSSLPLRQVGPNNDGAAAADPPSDPPQPPSILRNSRIHYPADPATGRGTGNSLSIPVRGGLLRSSAGGGGRQESSQLQREAPILARIRSQSLGGRARLGGTFADVATAAALLSGRPPPRPVRSPLQLSMRPRTKLVEGRSDQLGSGKIAPGGRFWSQPS